MTDITPPEGLAPKQMYSPTLGEDVINVDAAIAMMRDANTPQSRVLYRAFRRCLANERHDHPDLPAEKQRENALFLAFTFCGIRTTDHGKLDERFPE